MIPGNIGIIVSYVAPMELEKLFLENGFDFEMRFRYDMSSYKMTCEEISYVVRKFPNIMLMGLNVRVNQRILDIANVLEGVGMNKCVYIRRLQIRGSCRPVLCDVNLLGLEKCYDLRFFGARNCVVGNVNVLGKCRNMRYVDLMESSTYNDLELKLLEKVRYLCGPWYWCSFKLSQLYEMPKLRHLNGWGRNDDEMNKCLRVKSYVLHNSWVIPDFSTWYNLEFLCMIFDRKMKKILNGQLKCAKLRHVIVIGCEIIDLGIFDECTNLVTIEVINCCDVRNVEVERKGVSVHVGNEKCRLNRHKYLKYHEEFIESHMVNGH